MLKRTHCVIWCALKGNHFNLNSIPFAGNPITWSVLDVSNWLVSIEKSKFVTIFQEHEIDRGCLKLMDDESIRDIGISVSVHRKNLLVSIAESSNKVLFLFSVGPISCQTFLLLSFPGNTSSNPLSLTAPTSSEVSTAAAQAQASQNADEEADYVHDPSIY